jgi:hypothetical protein
MKKRITGILLLLVIFSFSLALSNCSQPTTSTRNPGVAALYVQFTPPPPEDKSEIGSTDGILIMGIVIVVITSLPILFHKRKKK